MSFSDKLRTSLWWFLSTSKPFIINNQYKIELLYIDNVNNSAKILVTNMQDTSIREVHVIDKATGVSDGNR